LSFCAAASANKGNRGVADFHGHSAAASGADQKNLT
jgi:hypothetical protein